MGWWVLGGVAVLLLLLAVVGPEAFFPGLLIVGGPTALIFGHVLLFRWLDGLMSVPATLGVLAGVYGVVAMLVFFWQDLLLWKAKPAPDVLPLDVFDLELAGVRECPAEVADALRAARHVLHQRLVASGLRGERVGLRKVVRTGSYLYLKLTTVSTYPDRDYVETVACTWWLAEVGNVMLSIDASARPQFRVRPSRSVYPGTPEGLDELLRAGRAFRAGADRDRGQPG